MARFKEIEALYIHIPFCIRICNYCDFYKMMANDDAKAKYIDYLIKELDMKQKYLHSIKTIYIGGGTPTSLDNNLLEKLLKAIEDRINVDNITEYSIEANPLDLNLNKCNLLAKYHINRVSIGAQSFNESRLSFLGRVHKKEDIVLAIKNLRKAKINNINLDLMYAVANDSFFKFKQDLKEAIKLKVNHISCYALILEEHTILYKLYKDGMFKELDDDKQAKIYRKLVRYLKKYGYNHYEISNFAKDGYESIHNLTYWNNELYLGIGASSAYYIDNTRYTNIQNLKKYYDGIDKADLIYYEKTKLSNLDQMKEEMILGLRKVRGVSMLNFNYKFSMTIYDAFGDIINDLLSKKLLKISSDNYLYIPENKLFVSNAIMAKFI